MIYAFKILNIITHELMQYRKIIVRVFTTGNAILSYFTILKNYFINYTIPFYNTLNIQLLFYHSAHQNNINYTIK